MAAALFALLAFAPFASAASDPLGSGTTTLKLNKGFAKALKKNGVKVLKVSPATVKGTTVTLPVSGGSLDPTTGQGTVNHSGGIKFKAGKKSATLTSFVLDTTKKSLSAKLGKKNLQVASVVGLSFTREGFGTNVKVGKLKLTSKAAKELNTKLGFGGKNGKKHKRASVSKASSKGVFKANQVLGGSTSVAQPSTVTILPGGNATLTTSLPTVIKLTKVKVGIETIAPTTVAAAGPPPAYAFPIVGESISTTATAGIVKTAGGLKLSQVFVPGSVETTMTLGAIWVDLGAKTASVEVLVQSKGISEKLNLGSLGRSSIADISLTGATVTANPTTRTVSVQNATATLQAVTAETLNSVFVEPFEKITASKAEHFAAGDPLGTFSFTAQTQ
ncbi:MAG TPA: hypothetical protein VNY83_04835 [Solirubrobacterales bacterium]|nr:hypothetical protein [Solirubrobacterales bacterium]